MSWLPPHPHSLRRDRLRRLLEGRWLLVSSPINIRYLCGFTGSAGHLLIGPEVSEDRLITDDRYRARAGTEAPDLVVEFTRQPVAAAIARARRLGDGTTGEAAAAGLGTTRAQGEAPDAGLGASRQGPAPRGLGARRQEPGGVDSGVDALGPEHEGIDGEQGAPGSPAGGDDRGGSGPVLGVEADHLTWAQAREAQQLAQDAGVRLLGMTGAVARLRMVKDDAEVARLTRANELTAAALEWLLDTQVRAGISERELAIALERRFVDFGADGVAFPSIVASGPNSASPHHAPTDRRLEPGDLLTIDAGALVDGYHADHTRTVGIGHLDAEAIAIHELVHDAQRAARAVAVAGASAGEVDAAARDLITEAGYGGQFVHGTGHGVGLEIHEAPSVARDAAATLAVGTTLTVEPGVYLPGTGGVRIEDSHVIVPDGPARALTDTPRELRFC